MLLKNKVTHIFVDIEVIKKKLNLIRVKLIINNRYIYSSYFFIINCYCYNYFKLILNTELNAYKMFMHYIKYVSLESNYKQI